MRSPCKGDFVSFIYSLLEFLQVHGDKDWETFINIQVVNLKVIMVSQSLGGDATSRQYGDVEGRLSLQEVPDKISKIFFGDPQQQYPQGRQISTKSQFQKLRKTVET